MISEVVGQVTATVHIAAIEQPLELIHSLVEIRFRLVTDTNLVESCPKLMSGHSQFLSPAISVFVGWVIRRLQEFIESFRVTFEPVVELLHNQTSQNTASDCMQLFDVRDCISGKVEYSVFHAATSA